MKTSRRLSCAIIMMGLFGMIPLAIAESNSSDIKMTFEQMMDLLVAKDLDLKQSSLDLRQAQEESSRNQYRYAPTVKAGAELDRSLSKGSSSRVATYSVVSNLNLYRFGADRAQVAASESQSESSKLALEVKKVNVTAEVAQLLLDYISAQARSDLAERSLQSKTEALDIVKRLFAKGYRPSQDVAKVDIDVENARSRAEDARSQVRILLQGIAIRTGSSAMPSSDWPWAETISNLNIESRRLEFEQHPAIRMYAEQYLAANAAVTAMRSSVLPSLDVQGGYSWTQDFADVKSPVQGAMTASLVLSVPIVSSVDDWNRIQEKVYARENSELAKEKIQQELSEAFDAAKLGLMHAQSSLKTRAGTKAAANDLYEKTLANFKRGVVNANELSLDQDRLIQAEALLLDARSELYRSYIKWCASQGKTLPCK